MHTSLATPSTPAMRGRPRNRSRRRWVLAALGLAAGLAAVFFAFTAHQMTTVPADLDLATTRPTAQGLYRATIQTGEIKINRLHSWTLHLETPDGAPLESAAITVDGDMPQHRHGMPTQPQVTRYLGNGDYLVEGMKFQMGGWWVVDFAIAAGGQTDTVRFNLMLQ